MTEQELLREICTVKSQHWTLNQRKTHWTTAQLPNGKRLAAVKRLDKQAQGLAKYLRTLNEYMEKYIK